MKKIIRLTESDLTRIVRRVLKEDTESYEIIPIKKEDIKSIGFWDGSKKNIIESFTVDTANGLVVKVKKVNFDDIEETKLRFQLDKKFIVNKIQQDDVEVYFMKNQPTLIVIKNPNDVLVGKQLKPNEKTYISNISIKNIDGATLPVSIKFHPDTQIVY
jgi:hypothetical protein